MKETSGERERASRSALSLTASAQTRPGRPLPLSIKAVPDMRNGAHRVAARRAQSVRQYNG
ncbi:hypothetical protein ACVIQT_000074 [Bradyrhizobium diazoefficiens]